MLSYKHFGYTLCYIEIYYKFFFTFLMFFYITKKKINKIYVIHM